MPAVLIPFFKTGAFAWHGAMEFWLAAVVFFGWVVVMTIVMFGAIRRQVEAEAERGPRAGAGERRRGPRSGTSREWGMQATTVRSAAANLPLSESWPGGVPQVEVPAFTTPRSGGGKQGHC